MKAIIEEGRFKILCFCEKVNLVFNALPQTGPRLPNTAMSQIKQNKTTAKLFQTELNNP